MALCYQALSQGSMARAEAGSKPAKGSLFLAGDEQGKGWG